MKWVFKKVRRPAVDQLCLDVNGQIDLILGAMLFIAFGSATLGVSIITV